MPIIVKDYSWRQTDSAVIIRVPCSKELSRNVDFITSNCYIKVNIWKPPPPRAPGSIQIKFSPRVFPTPTRESMAVEEEEWLCKQAEARRVAGFEDSDLSLEEKDPMWLKEKGDSFFKLGNYHGAIAAYTHGIKLSGKMPALYSNRASAHIALGNFFKAAEDASMALELTTPHTASNALARARCHSKRGAALWKLGLLDKGLVELCAARDLLKIHDKSNCDLGSLENDIESIKLKMKKCGSEESNEEDLSLING
ncbi:dynein axonemal assembly factor 4-like [Hetaerina americana]|uniref:dynein axonemal assembly factor 4-like n=1 Tax=Hetaerina americana TaxID=62018 RepID=UPI003A7F55AA